MKKILMTLGVALAATGFAASAQSAQCPRQTSCNPACETPAACGRAVCAGAPCDAAPCVGAPCGNPYDEMFAGLNLTDAQKQQLQTIRQQQRAARRANDSVSRVQRRQKKLDYLHAVKTVLTPEQYNTFLENMVVSGGARNGRHKMQARRPGQRQLSLRDGVCRDKAKADKAVRADSRKDNKAKKDKK